MTFWNRVRTAVAVFREDPDDVITISEREDGGVQFTHPFGSGVAKDHVTAVFGVLKSYELCYRRGPSEVTEETRTERVQITIKELTDGNYRAILGEHWMDGSTPRSALQSLALAPGNRFSEVFSDD